MGRGGKRDNRSSFKSRNRQVNFKRSNFNKKYNDEKKEKNKYFKEKKAVKHPAAIIDDNFSSSDSEPDENLPGSHTLLMETFGHSASKHDKEESEDNSADSDSDEADSDEADSDEPDSDDADSDEADSDEADSDEADSDNIHSDDADSNDPNSDAGKSTEEEVEKEGIISDNKALNGYADRSTRSDSDSNSERLSNDPVRGNSMKCKVKLSNKLKSNEKSSLNKELSNEEKELLPSSGDPFTLHFERCLSDSSADRLQQAETWSQQRKVWPQLGKIRHHQPIMDETIQKKPPKRARLLQEAQEEPVFGPQILQPNADEFDMNPYFIKEALQKNINELNPLQKEMLSVITNYSDLYYPEATHEKWDDITKVYSIHAINHILKTRARILMNNYILEEAQSEKTIIDTEQFRDQGLAKPKVLILVPSRHTAYRVVKCFAELLPAKGKQAVDGIKRFEEDFGPGEGMTATQKKQSKPADFKAIFTGDTSDCFKIGITLNRKFMKLYTGFYECDVIIASPLSLRLTTGVQGEEDNDTGFLTSIELLIMDQADIFFMQNWEHVLTVLDSVNLPFSKVSEVHTDTQRVRNWLVSGHGSLYRQTLLFAAATLDHHLALFGTMKNFAGKVEVYNPATTGDVTKVLVRAELLLVRVPGMTDSEKRLSFFTKEFLPQQVASKKTHTLLYIPDYCDYVAIHLFMSAERCIQFSSINEFMTRKSSQVAVARGDFFKGESPLLLYTERYHFYIRPTIKGIKHIVFYDLPTYPHFFSEMCNMMTAANQNLNLANSAVQSRQSITVLYQRSNVLKLAAVMGAKNTRDFINAEKSIHICTVSGR